MFPTEPVGDPAIGARDPIPAYENVGKGVRTRGLPGPETVDALKK